MRRAGALVAALLGAVIVTLFLLHERASVEPESVAVRSDAPARRERRAGPVVPAGDRRLAGRVLRGGAPVAGATVTAFPQIAPPPGECPCGLQCLNRDGCDSAANEAALETWALAEGETAPLGQVVTGADGTFALEHLTDEGVQLWVDGVAAAEAADGPVELSLVEPGWLKVAVRRDARPLPDVRVVAVVLRPLRRHEATTDERGVASFPGLLPGGHALFFEAPDGATATHFETVRAGFNWVEQPLPAAQRLLVHVRRGGAPVAGAQVFADDKLAGVTDARGDLSVLQPPQQTIAAAEGADRALIELPDKGADELTLDLEPTWTLELELTDDGRPAPDDLQIAVGLDEAHRVPGKPLGRGVYRFAGLSGTSVSVDLKGCWDPINDGFGPEKPGEVVRLELALTRLRGLKGRVVDAQGRAVGGAGIDLHTPENEEEPDGRVLDAKADGTFLLCSEGSLPWTVAASHPQHPTVLATVAALDRELVLVMQDGVTLSGRVVDAAGAPLAGTDVLLDRVDVGDTFRQTRTDARGAFTLVGVSDGDYTLSASYSPPSARVERPNFMPSASRALTVHGQPLSALELQVDTGWSVDGVVTDRQGQPIEGAAVAVVHSARHKDMPIQLTASDPEGRFHFIGLLNESYAITAQARDHLAAHAPVRKGEAVKLALQVTPQLTGHVAYADGQPLTEFQLDRVPVSSPDGAFRIPFREPGKLVLGTPAGRFVLRHELASVPDGDVELGVIHLPLLRTLRGECPPSAGGRAVGFVLDQPAFDEVIAPSSYAGIADASGHFAIEHVPDGAGTVLVRGLEGRTPVAAGQDFVVVSGAR